MKIEYNKTLLSSEKNNIKLGIFYENYKKISHNKNPERTYDLGINKFMDLTQEQFANIYMTAEMPLNVDLNVKHLSLEDLKDSVDWTKEGAVTTVKDHAGLFQLLVWQ